ncbi:MAG: PolC-type DNA polymerase III [Tissierellia bacterium]|nr:PolC-type DNA polymerase III [Tissierellia bacterium]
MSDFNAVFNYLECFDDDICLEELSEIKINRVIVNDELSLLSIFVEPRNNVNTETIKRITTQLESVFEGFKVSILISQCVTQEKDASIDREKILESIVKLSPSSCWWLDEDKINKDGNKVIIKCPDKSTLQSLQLSANFSEYQDQCEKDSGLEFLLELEIEGEEECSRNIDSYLDCKASEEIGYIKEVAKAARDNAHCQSKLLFGPDFNEKVDELALLTDFEGKCTILARSFDLEKKELKKSGRWLGIFSLTDESYSIKGKIFSENAKLLDDISNSMGKNYCLINGVIQYDDFEKSKTMVIRSIKYTPKIVTMDDAPIKRVELNTHSKMSNMEGVVDISSIIEHAISIGHDAMAITDNGVVQAFPGAMQYIESQKSDFKMLYGLQAYMVDDDFDSADMLMTKENSYVVFDLETTGLSPMNDGITEIGAVKVVNGVIKDEFSTFVNPERMIPYHITKLTGITDSMVANAPTIDKVIEDFFAFIAGSIIVAHNAEFDMGFIRYAAEQKGISAKYKTIDTLDLARRLFPQYKNHRLGTLCKKMGIDLHQAHRAIHDATATAKVFIKMMSEIENHCISTYGELCSFSKSETHKSRPVTISILAKDNEGLKNLYKLVSISHMEQFHTTPRLLKSTISSHRKGLLIGSGNSEGELYQGVLRNIDKDALTKKAEFYDYIEVQPHKQYTNLIGREVVSSEDDLIKINEELIKLGETVNVPVVATGEVHIIENHQRQFREILRHMKRNKPGEHDSEYYYRTTQQMLDSFFYLEEEKAFEIVVTNSRLISDSIDHIRPIPKGTFAPKMDTAEEELKSKTLNKAHELYGNPIPEYISERIERELSSIISNGYSVLYVIAQKIVDKSNEDGYLVGSRGSVGSSLVATLMGITEVNPLAPHYRCPHCKYSEFFTNNEYQSGLDLEDKKCPNCGFELDKDGHDIPFEVFLGFEGDKEPDIDLNFASEYQSRAHKYTESLFGSEHVFRAGTITTVANQTARGFVMKYMEDNERVVSELELDRLARGCEGVKRSTGQHPGGIMIVPKGHEIYDFTPIQYPADDAESGVITTHFEYKAISETILKLDLLGHDAPSAIRMLEELTGTNAKNIRTDDKKVMSLFTSSDALNMDQAIFKVNTGTLGVPEFGTNFVRAMLLDTEPKKFSDLVRISGLSHGTNVWVDNAQELVKNGDAVLSEVVSTREDVMLKLIASGMDKKLAFTVMERVRKGKGLTLDHEKEINELDLASWYIDSYNKISYLFPKAHAVAYVLMSFRIAYYKVNYPTAFYTTSFTIDIDNFDGKTILSGANHIKDKIKEIKSTEKRLSPKDLKAIDVYELALEMFARGEKFLPIDLYKSKAVNFTIEGDCIRPPLRALEGLGETVAKAIETEAKKGMFNSVEDFVNRTRANKSVVQALKEQGCLENLSEKNQLSFFSF